MEVLAGPTAQEMGKRHTDYKGIQIIKEEMRLPLFVNGMAIHVEDPLESTQENHFAD